MYQIKIIGEAATDYPNKAELHGINCQDEFTEYFHKRWSIGDKIYENQQCLMDKGVKEGYLHFEYNSESDKLLSVNTYSSEEELNEDELKVLANYTQGQWSDGIGEGFEQNPCHYDKKGREVFISPWFPGQTLEITQLELKF